MKVENSLSFQLLKVTFSIYLVVTVSVTAIYMYIEWQEYEKYLKKDLSELGASAQRGMILAMWDLDYKQVDFIAEGLLALPIVKGVRIRDRERDRMHGVNGDIVNDYDLVHTEGQNRFDVGRMTIYSSSRIVFERIKHVYILTVVIAILKTAALWAIVLWAGKKLIAKPLNILTEHSRLITLDQLTDAEGIPLQVCVKMKERNEIKILEEAFNDMLLKLLMARNNLQDLNQTLEQRVAERTRQLLEKNQELQQALEEVHTLREILPICSFCKNIRNDQAYYERLESYFQKRASVDFSHTICPDCAKKHYPEYF